MWRLLLPACCAVCCLLPLSAVSATAPRELIERPRNQTVAEWDAAAFFCRARGDPAPVISWRRNGRPVSPDLMHELSQGTALWLDPLRRANQGEYECAAENGVGDPARAAASLTVVGEAELPSGFPRITQHPRLQAVPKGAEFVVSCGTSGDPPPTLRWFKDGVPLNTSSDRHVPHDRPDGGDLVISDAVASDEGRYRCAAENAAGTAYSRAAAVYVRVRRVQPHFYVQPQPVYDVLLGASLNLTCVAVGSPVPRVRWRREPDDELTPEDAPITSRANLALRDLRRSTNYTCLAASALGTAAAFTQVRVHARPRAPTSLRATHVAADRVRLTWSYDHRDREAIRYYEVRHSRSGSTTQEGTGAVILQHVTWKALAPCTEYEFRVIAFSSVARSAPSDPVTVTTAPAGGVASCASPQEASSEEGHTVGTSFTGEECPDCPGAGPPVDQGTSLQGPRTKDPLKSEEDGPAHQTTADKPADQITDKPAEYGGQPTGYPDHDGQPTGYPDYGGGSGLWRQLRTKTRLRRILGVWRGSAGSSDYGGGSRLWRRLRTMARLRWILGVWRGSAGSTDYYSGSSGSPDYYSGSSGSPDHYSGSSGSLDYYSGSSGSPDYYSGSHGP